MNSKRALRRAFATVTACTALGGITPAAWAETDSWASIQEAPEAQTDSWASAQEAPEAQTENGPRTSTWDAPATQAATGPRASTREAPAARAESGHRASTWDAPVVRTGVWRTTAKPKIARRPQSSSKGFALDQVMQRAWPLREFRCLDALWTRESGWNHRAHNPSSGAYGIPQALPGGKMRGAGPDWRHNPETQIRWGLAYIKGRYGRPCGAWGHFQSHNWY